MTLEVIWYDCRGASNRAERERRVNEFENEREAAIFMDGLDQREDADFKAIGYPESGPPRPDPDW